MALGDSYATLAELKGRLGITDTSDDTRLTEALAAASRGIDHVCRRQFNKDTVATARLYDPTSRSLTLVDDFHTTTGLLVKTDDDDDGTFETTLAASDYQVEPRNGVVDGVAGWPFWRVRAVEAARFPRWGERTPVQVTAQWGWAAVPAPVKESCLILSEEIFKLRDTPFGAGGFGEFGRIRARENPHTAMMLAPYRRNAVRVA
ncbi:MAG: phage head-tail connector protein [Sporichthyaceae bacterium]|nr:phage head-tail connector protein [Sporichthyaceae bacterium]